MEWMVPWRQHDHLIVKLTDITQRGEQPRSQYRGLPGPRNPNNDQSSCLVEPNNHLPTQLDTPEEPILIFSPK
jgi:hypothetical protein